MPKATTPNLFVVDGSNIATEGRSQPSLEQLNEAVLAFLDERANTTVTVVVDATFGHRIAKKEVKAFDEAVANNELVTPPAGAIGRGDAFVLSIAHKAGAGVLSNDSFQEFHGDYDWLFDEGRLVGGKPVPHVGWVFVNRTPVRGPKSRRSVKEAKDGDKTDAKQQANRRVRAKRTASDADTPAPEPAVESGRKRGRRSERAPKQATGDVAATSTGSKDHVNELMPFLDFVERHPVGTSCTAQVESYASHGAYARTGDVLIYIPLRLMDDPTPRSARSVLKVGEAVALVVVGFTPDRRSIDAAMPHMASGSVADVTASTESEQPAPAKKSPAKKTPAKKTATKKAAAKSTSKKSPAKKSAAKKTATKRTATKKAAAEATSNKTPAKKTAAKKAPAKRAPARKAPAKTTATKTASASKASAKKASAKKAPAKKASARKAPARKASAKKAPAKKSGS